MNTSVATDQWRGRFGPFQPAPGALPRPRVLALLAGAESRRLTLIVADSGYGKTTLLAQWGATLPDLPQTWYSLRSIDRQPRIFERHLVVALSHLVAMHRPARTVAQALDGLENHVLLVLDDVNHLNEKGMAILKGLLDHPLLHSVFASRVPLSIPLPRLELQGQVVQLSASDLAFTQKEIAEIGLEGDPAELWAQTQGWPAAVALMRLGGSLQKAGSREELFSLLAEEVWSQLSDRERSMLELAAVAGTVGTGLAQDVMLNPAVSEVLEGFTRRGWLRPVSPDRFECHSLVREFVLRRMPTADRAALAQRALNWIIDHGEPEEAGAISTLCTPKARYQFLKQFGALLTRTGGAAALREALDGLPYDPEEPPEITTSRGRLHNLEGRFAEALEWLKGAQEQAARKENWRMLARATAYEAEICGHRGEHAKAAMACRTALATIDGRDKDGEAELEGFLSLFLFYLGKIDEAMTMLERARAWFEQRGNTQQESIIIRRRGAIHSMRGDLAEALRWEGIALTRFRQIREPLGEANVRMNLGTTLARAGRFEEARAQLQTALALAERHGFSGMDPQIRLALATVSAETGGDIGPVPAALESERDLCLWHLLSARVARRKGALNQAWQALGAGRSLLPQLNPSFRTKLEVEEAAVLLVQEDLEAALGIFEPAVESLWDGPWRVDSYLPRLHRAFGRLRTGQQRGAKTDLTILLDWRTEADLGALLAPEAWAAVPLLEFAQKNRMEPGFAVALLRRLGAPARAVAEAPIRVDVLGPLRVARNGTTVPESAFGWPQVREMLAYLAVHHPRPVPTTELVEALWPKSGRIEESSLYTTVSRLRRALGKDAVIKDSMGYRLSPEIEVDASLFGRALAAQPPRWHEALTLWRGNLLADLPLAEWCFLARETYGNRFLEAATRYGEICLAQKDYEEARSAFERALKTDSCCEPAVQGLLRVLVLTGDAPRALRLYQHFAETLKRELDMAPSDETLRLVQRLAG